MRVFYSFIFVHTMCGILVSWPGIEPAPPAVEVSSLNCRIPRKVPKHKSLLIFMSSAQSWCSSSHYISGWDVDFEAIQLEHSYCLIWKLGPWKSLSPFLLQMHCRKEASRLDEDCLAAKTLALSKGGMRPWQWQESIGWGPEQLGLKWISPVHAHLILTAF